MHTEFDLNTQNRTNQQEMSLDQLWETFRKLYQDAHDKRGTIIRSERPSVTTQKLIDVHSKLADVSHELALATSGDTSRYFHWLAYIYSVYALAKANEQTASATDGENEYSEFSNRPRDKCDQYRECYQQRGGSVALKEYDATNAFITIKIANDKCDYSAFTNGLFADGVLEQLSAMMSQDEMLNLRKVSRAFANATNRNLHLSEEQRFACESYLTFCSTQTALFKHQPLVRQTNYARYREYVRCSGTRNQQQDMYETPNAIRRHEKKKLLHKVKTKGRWQSFDETAYAVSMFTPLIIGAVVSLTLAFTLVPATPMLIIAAPAIIGTVLMLAVLVLAPAIYLFKKFHVRQSYVYNQMKQRPLLSSDFWKPLKLEKPKKQENQAESVALEVDLDLDERLQTAPTRSR